MPATIRSCRSAGIRPVSSSVPAVYPRATTLAVIPSGPSCAASDSTHPPSAAFAATYAGLAPPVAAARDPTMITRPPGRRTIGSSAEASRTALITFFRYASSHAAAS